MPNEVGICNYFGMHVKYLRGLFSFFPGKNGFLTAYIMSTKRCPHKFHIRIKSTSLQTSRVFKISLLKKGFVKIVLALKETIQKRNLELSKKKCMFIYNYL